jgi:hypothetical protein
LCQTNQIDIVINKYKVVHTGAKTQSGGVRLVFIKLEYHGYLYVIVATLPINDAEYVTIAKTKKDINLFFNILIYISFDHER